MRGTMHTATTYYLNLVTFFRMAHFIELCATASPGIDGIFA